MLFQNTAFLLALATAAMAAPADRRQSGNSCLDTYNQCIANGVNQIVCACDQTACLGEDDARERSYCSSATADLGGAVTSIPGGCNPAHPGSCPTTTSSVVVATTTAPAFTSISGIPGGCNPAHPGSCPTTTAAASPSFTSTVAPAPAATSAAAAAPAAHYTDPKPVDGVTWTINDLNRYCAADNSGCDYNFNLVTDKSNQNCTIIRMPGSNAATESWSNIQCTTDSPYTISWGYVENPAPAYAVLTVVDGPELAWFGVSNINGNPVTASSPFGSGVYGNLPAEQVYTY